MTDFAKFNALIDSLYPEDAIIHGRLHNKRMLLLFIELIRFFKENLDLVPAHFRSTLAKLNPDNPPEDWLTVCAMRESGRIQSDGSYIDRSKGKAVANAGFRTCKAHLIEARKPKHVAHFQAEAIVDCEKKTAPNSLLSFLLKHATTLETLRDTTAKTVDLNWLPSWELAELPEQKSAIRKFVLEHLAFIERQQGFRHVTLEENGERLAPIYPKESPTALNIRFLNQHWTLSQKSHDEMHFHRQLKNSRPVDRWGADVKCLKEEHTSTEGVLDVSSFTEAAKRAGYLVLFNATETWSWAVSVVNKWATSNLKNAAKELRFNDPVTQPLVDNQTLIKHMPRDQVSLFTGPDKRLMDVHLSMSNTLEDDGEHRGECTAWFLQPNKVSGYTDLAYFMQGKDFNSRHFLIPLAAQNWHPLIATFCGMEIQKLISQAGEPPRKACNIALIHTSEPFEEYVTVTEPCGFLSEADARDRVRLKEVINEENLDVQFRLNVSRSDLPIVREYGEAKPYFMDLKSKIIPCIESWRDLSIDDIQTDLPALAALLNSEEYENEGLKFKKTAYVTQYAIAVKTGRLRDPSVEFMTAQHEFHEALLESFVAKIPASINEFGIPTLSKDAIVFLRNGDLSLLVEADQKIAIQHVVKSKDTFSRQFLRAHMHLIEDLPFLYTYFDRTVMQWNSNKEFGQENFTFSETDIWNCLTQIAIHDPDLNQATPKDGYEVHHFEHWLGFFLHGEKARIQKASSLAVEGSRFHTLLLQHLEKAQTPARSSSPFADGARTDPKADLSAESNAP